MECLEELWADFLIVVPIALVFVTRSLRLLLFFNLSRLDLDEIVEEKLRTTKLQRIKEFFENPKVVSDKYLGIFWLTFFTIMILIPSTYSFVVLGSLSTFTEASCRFDM